MVFYLSEKQEQFQDLYLAVRKKEHRLYTDEEVMLLPYVGETHPHYEEWLMRLQSTSRFLRYLSEKDPGEVLEIGCGNGWFTNRMATVTNATVTGLDVNEQELEQADRVFHADNLRFVYANLFEDVMPENHFDLIVLNSSVQYFSDFGKLQDRLFGLLGNQGELHILDSPFYPASKLNDAIGRSRAYYHSIGCESMASHYFHHSLEEVKDFAVMYKPGFLSKLLRSNDSPFMWLKKVKP